MNLILSPSKLSGAVTPPPSKSQSHRMILAAALAGGVSTLSNVALSQDIQATLGVLSALGARVEHPAPGCVEIHGLGDAIPQPAPDSLLDCGESGSTLRFLIPVALVVAGEGRFTGHGRLMERPQGPYETLFAQKGMAWKRENGILTTSGTLVPGTYQLPGDVSSQFITGLLYALPLLEGDSQLILTTPLESRGYVDMTLEVLARFGIEIQEEEGQFHIPGGQHYRSGHHAVEGDWSQAGFWYAANFLGNAVEVQGLDPNSTQGDRQIALDYWKLARPGEVTIDVSQCPDLVPPLAAMAAVRVGTAHLTNAARLRIKESDRLSTVAATLNALGAQVEEHPDHLTIHGVERLAGGVTVDSCNDHRIAMMAAIAATACDRPVTLTGAQCVAKSYPDFWEHYRMLGGITDGILPG